MGKSKRIYVIRGAGLSFPVAALLFVLTWNGWFFLLIPAGAAAGFLVGLALTKRSPAPGAAIEPQVGKAGLHPLRRTLDLLANVLLNENLVVRFAGLLAVGCALFILAWVVGYAMLPEGALRAGAEAHMRRGALGGASQSVAEEWVKILRANLVPVLIIVLGSLLIRINRIPFGYLVVFYNLALYGLFVGTNSFAIPYAQRMAPSLAILGRSGPYEMAALTLLAAASASWSFFEVKRLFRTVPERVTPAPRFRLPEVVALVLGLGLMMAANWAEAAMIVSQAAGSH